LRVVKGRTRASVTAVPTTATDRNIAGQRGAQRRHLPAKVLEPLTERERKVLSLVAQGLTNEEIAARLYMSPLAAKNHVSRAMSKLAARDRAQLVVIAYETGLVVPGSPG
jgi:DNA-binding NarL/FixJ family response regulator